MNRIYLSLLTRAAVDASAVVAAERHRTFTYGTGEESAAADEWYAALRARSETESESCPIDGCKYGRHDSLWTVSRHMRPWGHFATAVINPRDPRGRFGPSEVVDGSLPHTVAYLPTDAVRVSAVDCHNLWTVDNESHTFGGPNVAAALRAAVAAANGR